MAMSSAYVAIFTFVLVTLRCELIAIVKSSGLSTDPCIMPVDGNFVSDSVLWCLTWNVCDVRYVFKYASMCPSSPICLRSVSRVVMFRVSYACFISRKRATVHALSANPF